MGTEALSEREIVGRFYHELENTEGDWAADIVWANDQADQGVGIAEIYRWLGAVPQPREFVGGRQPVQLRQEGWAITNKRWEASIKVPLMDWTKDKTGQIKVRVGELADSYADHRLDLIGDLIVAGESTACYDGQYFFDTDHATGASGTQSNDLSVDISALAVTTHGSTTAPSVEEAAACLLQAMQAIIGFKDDQGRVMNRRARRFKVVTPLSLWPAFFAAANSSTVNYAGPNVLALAMAKGYQIEVVADPASTWTTKFAMFRTDGRVKPFIWQTNGSNGVNAKVLGPESEYATIHDECLVATDAENNAGYGYWQHACLVTMA
jgi:phage major head subunit gpT-like protein